MPETIRCPDCGHENPAGRLSCEACNFPFEGPGVGPAAIRLPEPPAVPPTETSPGAGAPPGRPSPIVPRGERIVTRDETGGGRILRPRPRRPRPATNLSVTLWLMFGLLAAVTVIGVAVQGFVKSNAPAVEGSSEAQQRRADELHAILARDSTNVDANIELANLFYDTGNWTEAIGHYRTAIARDSSRTRSIVDLGVCYFNLGDASQAKRMFLLALARDPNQPVALFNLGIVSQQAGDHKAALGYFHRALMSNPPEGMKPALMEAMQHSTEASGTKPPPLPDGH